MIRSILVITAIFVLFGPFVATAADLNTEVYPSEDELYEAFLRGDLDYETYRNLVDLIETGLDNSDIYLLEELPGIGPIRPGDSTIEINERAEPYRQVVAPAEVGEWHGYLKVRNSRQLEATDRYKTYYLLNSVFGSRWRIKTKLNRNENGIHEWTQRSAEYSNRRGTLKRARLGSYTARFGLGLSLGYRGRLLAKGDEESDESMLFPDFSGFNGVYLEGSSGRNPARWLVHYDRNDSHNFRMSAVSLSARHKRLSGELIGLGAILENRQSGVDYKYIQGGTFVRYDAINYDISGELAIQQYTRNLIGAASVEGTFDFNPIKIWGSFWHYAEDFVNLTGGGRSGRMSRTVSIDSLDFSVSDRRTGQDGFRLKSHTALSDKTNATAAVSHDGFNQFHKNVELYTALAHRVGNNSSLSLDYRFKRNYDNGEISSDNETRLEYKMRRKQIFLRTYIGYQNDDDRDFVMLFARASARVSSLGDLELWCNLDKINIDSRQLDYMYFYVQEKLPVRPFLHVIAKYTYRYSRAYSDRKQSAFYIEGRAIW